MQTMYNESTTYHNQLNETQTPYEYFGDVIDDNRIDRVFNERHTLFTFATTPHETIHETFAPNAPLTVAGSFSSIENDTSLELVLTSDHGDTNKLLQLAYHSDTDTFVGFSEQYGIIDNIQLSLQEMTDLSFSAFESQTPRLASEPFSVERLTKLWSELSEARGGVHVSHATAIQSFDRSDGQTLQARASLTEEETVTSSLRTLVIEHSLIHQQLDAETVYRLELHYESNGAEGRHTQDASARKHIVSQCSPELISMRLSAKNVTTGVSTELDPSDTHIIEDFKKTLEAMLSNAA